MKLLSYKEIAEALWQNQEVDGYGIDFYCNYDQETGEKEWAYRIGIISFADAPMVIANYYGGGAGFVYDIGDDGDPSGLAYCIQNYFDDQGCEESVWVEEDGDGE